MESTNVKFKPGDIVRRTSGSWNSVKEGDIATVAECFSRSVGLVGHVGSYDPQYFELASNIPTTSLTPLKVTPLTVQVGGDHYRKMAIQPMEYILANDIPFVEGCVIKYVSRWKNKGGLQDLKKARHNLDFLIEREEKKAST